MQKLLRKGAVGVVLYVQALQMEENVASTLPVVEAVLEQHKTIFQEPTELPPKRAIDHIIPLQPGSKVVNTRRYKLSRKQKNTMEELINNLLKNQVIRPSVSPYSSPAIW
jgi:hypothetical protein